MRENTELLMVALELRLMAHQIGQGGRATLARHPFQDRLTLAAEALEELVRGDPEASRRRDGRPRAQPAG